MIAALAVVSQRLKGLSVKDLTRVLTARSFQYAPRVFKYFAFLLFLLQIRSWPLAWHWVVWRPVFVLRGRYLLHRLSHCFSSPAVRRQKNLEWLEGLSHVGMNPFDLEVTYKSWAGPDDCDFNLHLSNSSYPKRLDPAHFKHALQFFPTFFRVGGWMALGATHFTFLREIPMFSHYEMRTSVMSWDNKWIYVVTRFVTKPKKRKGKKLPARSHLPSTPPAEAAPRPSLHTADGVSTPSSSSSGTPSPPNCHANGHGPATSAKALAAQLLDRPEPDGAVVNCLAISEVCCKIGRLTIPPSLVIAVEGFCAAPPLPGARPYSRTNPAPHWEHIRQLRGDAHAPPGSPGSLKKLRSFFVSGWRDVPEGERWWEDALGAEVEERRLRGLGSMQALRKGMEEARAI